MVRRLTVAILSVALAVQHLGCSVFTAHRTRVLEAHDVEEPGELCSTTPKETRVEDVTVSLAGVAGTREPCVVVKVSARRTLVYEATVVTQRVEDQLCSRADRIVGAWPHELGVPMLEEPITMFLLPFFLALAIPWDLVFWPWQQVQALLYAGDALDEVPVAETRMLQNDGASGVWLCTSTVASTARRTQVFPPEPTGKTCEITKTIEGPVALSDVSVEVPGAPRRWAFTTDASGTLRIPVAELARAPRSALIVEALGVTRTLALDGAAGEAVAAARRARGEAIVCAARPGESLGPGDGDLLAAGCAAQDEGDLAAAVVAFGTLVARSPGVASQHGLRRLVPQLLRESGCPPAPGDAVAAVASACDAVAASDGLRARAAADAAIERAPWWSRGHELRAAASILLQQRGAACASLQVALALTAEGSPEEHELRAKLVRWESER